MQEVSPLHYFLLELIDEDDVPNRGYRGGGKHGGEEKTFCVMFKIFLHYESCYRQAVFTGSRGGPSSQGSTTEV